MEESGCTVCVCVCGQIEREICRADVARCIEIDVHAHVRLDIRPGCTYKMNIVCVCVFVIIRVSPWVRSHNRMLW